MELGWSALAFLSLAGIAAWFWQDSLGARERANAAAIEACERLSLQFLDGTVAFARIALTRAAGGQLALRRTYVFDYTANSIERLQGFVVLLAHRVESVGYAQSHARPPVQIELTHVAVAQPSEPGHNVLHLENWRARPDAQSPPANEDSGDQRH